MEAQETQHMRRKTRNSRRTPNTRDSREAFGALVATARRLQAPGGCPWDRAQTVRSLLPHLIEETWEVFASARTRDHQHLREELGDVLYTVVFLTLLAERDGWFELSTLLEATRAKMIARHPHVFGTTQVATAAEAYRQWQSVKRRETPRHSSANSKAVRPLMVALWRELLAHKHAAPRVLKRTLATLRSKTGRL